MGPLAHLPALDVMWISFYCIFFLLASIGIIYMVRHKIHNRFLQWMFKLIAYGLFFLGSFLMVLVVATWPA
ncbi:DUF2768 domain-containing protein [Caryophanon tenue]|uniref:NAD(FAD)-dependent dehydrogenase n=1 Tax=Caryophanon tenue TaxID=33978 RepID=A0A1C0YKW1_9BACL|nr:DUF2768 domain-containing protein [Caryophanon tenue]OCS87812.1 NAD(FAD)-dependent dehydrogenase [Caryophanon tenue]